VVLRAPARPGATARRPEAARQAESDLIVNLQGDEPLIEPETLDLLPPLLEHDAGADVATLATPIRTLVRWQDANVVKVVCDRHGRALYFSRSPIPFVRGGRPDFGASPP